MLYVKALHIIFVVTWFAGLFYIVRLFIYHTEAESRPDEERRILQAQYKVMERRLWYGITWPSCILVWIFGTWLVSYNYEYYLTSAWFLAKLGFVTGLTAYHLICHRMFGRLQRGIIKNTSGQLRVWNEVATVVLVAVVFLVELQNALSAVYGVLGLICFSALLMSAIIIYRNYRKKNGNKQ
jgi:putative membrane protein